MMQQSVSSQVSNLLTQLNTALLRKHALDAQVKSLDEKILALCNVVAGIELGKKLQDEAAKEAASPAPVPPTTK